MESMTVPIISLVSGVILWCIWLTIKTFQNDKAIAINTSNDAAVNSQINNLTGRIDKLETHIDSKFDQVSNKFDKVFEMLTR